MGEQLFLLQSLGAAYTPIAVDSKGRVYSMNGGVKRAEPFPATTNVIGCRAPPRIRGGWDQPAWPATESRRSRSKAALINARCVNAWGKLPRCCAWGPSSSPYSPR
jgi:hypothetical protein